VEREAAMSVKSLVLISGFALLGAAITTPSRAQNEPRELYPSRVHRARPRIEITPRLYPYPRLYRRCVERLQLQYRPSGPVLYPQTYCWWVRG
jgi:hypothetical protein